MTSLRGRLLFSHLMVIGLAMLLTFVVALIPVLRSEQQLEISRLEELAAPVVAETAYVLQRPALGPAVVGELLDVQSRQLNARILLFDQNGSLAYDTAADQPLPANELQSIRRAASNLPNPASQTGALARALVASRAAYAGTFRGQRVVVARVPQAGGRYIAIEAPRQRLPLLRQLFLPVLLAALVGVIGSVIATFFLSRSIARPISRLTTAANRVAAGDLEHQVPGEGPDEVGHLVHSFNSMVDRLRAANESQRRLLANIAHELRTPLTSVQGYAQGLADGIFERPEERNEALQAIQEESERVNELVVQILQLARLESGESRPRLRPVNVSEIVDRVLRRHRVAAESAGITLIGPVPTDVQAIADESLLEQAIDNLVRNAVRHTPAGGSVRIGLAMSAAPGSAEGRLRIRVSDTGPGIAAADLPYIFDRFYRAPNTTGRDGFGLGLAIVREIASNHGGEVSVESEPGQGATFVLDLPLRQTEPDSSTQAGILEQTAQR